MPPKCSLHMFPALSSMREVEGTIHLTPSLARSGVKVVQSRGRAEATLPPPIPTEFHLEINGKMKELEHVQEYYFPCSTKMFEDLFGVRSGEVISRIGDWNFRAPQGNYKEPSSRNI